MMIQIMAEWEIDKQFIIITIIIHEFHIDASLEQNFRAAELT